MLGKVEGSAGGAQVRGAVVARSGLGDRFQLFEEQAQVSAQKMAWLCLGIQKYGNEAIVARPTVRKPLEKENPGCNEKQTYLSKTPTRSGNPQYYQRNDSSI